MGVKPKIFYTYKGKVMTITELSEFSIVCDATLRKRLENGWNIHDAVNQPIMTHCQKSRGGEPKENLRYRSYTKNTTEDSIAKAKTNHKMEELIEKRLLEKELDDF